MKIIAAADANWAIGYRGDLLVRIPEDLKFFRDMTLGKTVIMGRKTLDSLPGGRPLPGRKNVVLTRDLGYQKENVIVIHNLTEVFQFPEAFVIGGASIYQQLLPYCDTAYITKICKAFPADVYFPNLKKDKNWILAKISEKKRYQDLEYQFQVWERI